MSQSFVVLGCRAWISLPHDMKILPIRALFVSAVRRIVRGVDQPKKNNFEIKFLIAFPTISPIHNRRRKKT
jgi:hypothetical protein